MSIACADFRLPKNIIPTHYELEIKPSIEKMTFYAKISISLNILSPIDKIYLNAVSLQFNMICVKIGSDEINDIKTEQDTDNEIVCFHLHRTVEIGEAIIMIEYDGLILETMKGLYLTTYYDKDGVLHNNLATQFEAADARRVLPCFDEPCFKATFKLTVILSGEQVVLSNTEKLLHHYENDIKYTHRFKATPRMSTYLFSFVIGDFDTLSVQSTAGITTTVHFPYGDKETASYALSTMIKLLDFYDGYFGIPYPLNKMDCVALPDISIGAMENWGLITFREDLLLVGHLSSKLTIRNVTLVMAHEFAHQWFGNLVTMSWWTDLWLNEGFANFIEYVAVGHCFGHLNIWKSFIADNIHRAMELDSLVNTHPVQVTINRVSELDEIFDDITYSKGASLINMMYHYIGDDNFSTGINQYFNKHKYDNVTTDDLWTSLEAASGKQISSFMKSFTLQSGYPYVKVSFTLSSGKINFTFSQHPFFLDGVTNAETMWMIPITMCIHGQNKSMTVDFMLEKAQHSIDVEFDQDIKYIIVNPERNGFYRIFSSSQILKPIVENITQLSYADKLGNISDLFAFARSGYVPTSDYLDFILNFKDDLDEEVWDSIAASLLKIYSLLHYSPSSNVDIPRFKKMVVKLVRPILNHYKFSKTMLGFKPENEVKLICCIVNLLAFFDPDLIAELESWVKPFIHNGTYIDPDLRRFLFRAALGSSELIGYAIDYFYTVTSTEERVDIIHGASGAKDPNIIEDLCDFAVSDGVKPQDGRFLYSVLGRSPSSRLVCWNFIKNNIEHVLNRFESPLIIARILKDTISGFADREIHDEIQVFFNQHPEIKVERSLLQGIEHIHINTLWITRDHQNISTWLENHSTD